jgi:hypothetical protein
VSQRNKIAKASLAAFAFLGMVGAPSAAVAAPLLGIAPATPISHVATSHAPVGRPVLPRHHGPKPGPARSTEYYAADQSAKQAPSGSAHLATSASGDAYDAGAQRASGFVAADDSLAPRAALLAASPSRAPPRS